MVLWLLQWINCDAAFTYPSANGFSCCIDRITAYGAVEFGASREAFRTGKCALCGSGTLEMLVCAYQIHFVAVAGARGILYGAAGTVFIKISRDFLLRHFRRNA